MKVELIDYTEDGMHKVARLARATRKNQIDEDNIHQGSKDEEFIRALIKVKHYGVLEHINFTFYVSEVSRALSHQLVRHRMASYLQQSDRHVKPKPDGYVIPYTIASTENPEATSYSSKRAWDVYIDGMNQAYDKYQHLISLGVPIEDARYILPPAFFTHISFTCNARSLRHFLELRLHKSAQWEIAELACRIYDIVYKLYPILFEDLSDLRKQAGDRLGL
jgi:thymidylate synthase (FAD)